jgi:transposase
VTAGCFVVRVPVQLMAAARRTGRQPGKSDPIDALAVAHAALREPDLPAARLDGPAREVKLLSDHRRNLVTERTILCNRLRWHLPELDPGLQVPWPAPLRRPGSARRTARRVERRGGPHCC